MKCRICGNENNNRSYELQEMMFGYRDIFRYFQCCNCNCLQIEEFPGNISKYYPDQYYSHEPISKNGKLKRYLINLSNEYAIHGRGFIGRFLYGRHRTNRILRSLSSLQLTQDTSILDIGCGVGTLLYFLRELGFKNLLGIDPFNKKDVEYPNGVKILKKEISEVDGQWDLIMLHHSFEHLPDPKKTLETVFALLNAGGDCVIRTPIVPCYA